MDYLRELEIITDELKKVEMRIELKMYKCLAGIDKAGILDELLDLLKMRKDLLKRKKEI